MPTLFAATNRNSSTLIKAVLEKGEYEDHDLLAAIQKTAEKGGTQYIWQDQKAVTRIFNYRPKEAAASFGDALVHFSKDKKTLATITAIVLSDEVRPNLIKGYKQLKDYYAKGVSSLHGFVTGVTGMEAMQTQPAQAQPLSKARSR